MANDVIKINRPFTTDEIGGQSDTIKINRPFTAKELKNQNISGKVIPQFTKGLYETLPFGKRIISMLPNAQIIQQTQENIPQPTNLPAKLGRTIGEQAPNIAMATPFVGGAGALPFIGKSALATGVTGLGAYSGTRAAIEKKPILPAVVSGAGQGLLYGVGGRVGATLMPKALPFAETIGSALGAGTIGAATAPEGEKLASGIFMSGLAALNPSQRYDFSKALALRTNLRSWGEKVFRIPQETTDVIYKNGFNEVKKWGELATPSQDEMGNVVIKNTPQLMQDNLKQGDLAISKRFNNWYENIIKPKLEKIIVQPKELATIMPRIQSFLNQITSSAETKLARVTGRQFGEHLTPEENVYMQEQLRRAGIKDMNLFGALKQITNQVIEPTNLFEIDKATKIISDTISAKDWKATHPSNEGRIGENIVKELRNFISQKANTELKSNIYNTINSRYSEYKKLQETISDLNTKNLSTDWNKLPQAQKTDFMNKINFIESIFKKYGQSQFLIKDPLQKYHAYQAWANPDLASLRAGIGLRIGLQTLGTIVGGGIGTPLGLKGVLGGAALGNKLGQLTAIKYLRPQTYKPILEKITPKTK